jgi:multidrug efflux system outer membrane protein
MRYEVSAEYCWVALSSFREVEDRLVALRLLRDESKPQDSVLAESKHALELVIDRYRRGASDYLNVATTHVPANNGGQH